MNKEALYTQELLEILHKISGDKKFLHEFLLDLLTPQEYGEIVKRWQIVKLLAKGMPQREIAKELEVSIATITRGSRELLNKQGGFQRVLKMIERN